MKYGLFFLFAFFSIHLSAQRNYKANDHVGYRISQSGEDYVIKYTFKDPWGALCRISWSLDKSQTDKDISKFGIPKWMFDPYPDRPDVRAKRYRILSNGLFKVEKNTIMVDKNAMINTYQDYTKVLAEWMVDYLREYYVDSRLNRIRLAMAFVQDIPYAIPEDVDPNWYYGGVIATPNILTCGYGDCDTKAILFAGILCHLIDPNDLRFAGEPGHMYTLIKANPRDLDQDNRLSYYQLPEGKFFVAETAGPGRLDFGQEGNLEYSYATIEKVRFRRE